MDEAIYEKSKTESGTTMTVVEEAGQLWIKIAQTEDFREEIEYLRRQKSIAKNSICPQINHRGIFDLGGRLELATCLEDKSKRPYF